MNVLTDECRYTDDQPTQTTTTQLTLIKFVLVIFPIWFPKKDARNKDDVTKISARWLYMSLLACTTIDRESALRVLFCSVLCTSSSTPLFLETTHPLFSPTRTSHPALWGRIHTARKPPKPPTQSLLTNAAFTSRYNNCILVAAPFFFVNLEQVLCVTLTKI